MLSTGSLARLAFISAILSGLALGHPSPQGPTTLSVPAIDTTSPINGSSVGLNDYMPKCNPPFRRMPSDFNCKDALHQFTSTLNPDLRKKYTVTKTAVPFWRNSITVPKVFRSGACEFVLDLKNRLPPVTAEGILLSSYATHLVDTCVADEGHSGGGVTDLVFPQARGVPDQHLTFEVRLASRPSGQDGDGDGSVESITAE